MRCASHPPAITLVVLLGILFVGVLPVSSARAQERAASAETRFVEVDGVAMVLPAGWQSTPTARDGQGSVIIVAEELADSSAFRGARLVVEVVPGLNRLQQERWLRGQLLRGLDASYQIEPTDRALFGSLAGAAVTYAFDGRRGYALYTRGGPFYALRIEAPLRLWSDERARSALLSLAKSVRVRD